MRVCLISSDDRYAGAGASSAVLARLLATRHEVTLVRPEGSGVADAAGPQVREIFAEPSAELAAMAVASGDHLRSAAVLEAIERAYGDEGPHYLEGVDRQSPALVAIQAQRAGHRSLRETRFGVRLVGSRELTALQDGSFADPDVRIVSDLERAQLRMADRLLWPGGDGLDLYRRYYGGTLPEGVRVPVPFDLPERPPKAEPRDTGGPLRILYCGLSSRGKGVGDLAEACLRLPRDDWRLTIRGPDTATTPFKQSMSGSIEEMFAGDPRLTIQGPSSQRELPLLFAEHDVLIAPSRFDVWPVQVLEAMASGLPVLATPVGGLAEIVEPGVTGWLLDGIGPGRRPSVGESRSSSSDGRRSSGSESPGRRSSAPGRSPTRRGPSTPTASFSTGLSPSPRQDDPPGAWLGPW